MAVSEEGAGFGRLRGRVWGLASVLPADTWAETVWPYQRRGEGAWPPPPFYLDGHQVELIPRGRLQDPF